MPYKLTLVDDQGVVLYTWEIGGDDGYPLPVRAMGAADIIATINREIEIDQRDQTGESIECHGCTDPTAHTPADLGIGGVK